MGGDRDQPFRAGRGLFCAITLHHGAQCVFAGHRHNGRLKFERLLKEQIGIGAGREPHHAKLVGMRAHDIQCALPYRAGRSENRNVFHDCRVYKTRS